MSSQIKTEQPNKVLDIQGRGKVWRLRNKYFVQLKETDKEITVVEIDANLEELAREVLAPSVPVVFKNELSKRGEEKTPEEIEREEANKAYCMKLHLQTREEIIKNSLELHNRLEAFTKDVALSIAKAGGSHYFNPS